MKKQELEELKVSIYEKLRRAIKEGDKEKALELLDETDLNKDRYRNFFMTLIDTLYTYGADKLGEEFVNRANRIFSERKLFPAMEWAFGPVSAEDKLRDRAYMWTSVHGTNLEEIEEDEEKFTIKLKCPTGGSIRAMEQYGKTKKAYPWSCGQEGVCYYCTHCHIPFEVMAIERFGYPAWVCVPQPEGRCIQYIFKNPGSVPQEYYKRVGMEKKMSK